MKTYKCKRCGHEWTPRIEKKPRACPGCKNYKWDEEKDNKDKD